MDGFSKELIKFFLDLNGIERPSVTELQKLYQYNTRSKIIRSNNNKLYYFKIRGFEGLFVKEKENTFKFGRKYCDMVINNFDNYGFFTSDELPRYGINRTDKKQIFEKVDKIKKDKDLVIFMAYNEEESQQIREFLIDTWEIQGT